MSGFSFSDRYNEVIHQYENINNLTLDELKTLKQHAEEVQNEYNNLQLVVKRNCNSLYGVSANKFFSLHDTDVAEDITITGKHYAVIVDIAINKFFGKWNVPKVLSIVQEFYPKVNKLRNFTEYVPDTVNDLCAYGDTDSRYVTIDTIYSLMYIDDKPMEVPTDDKELTDFVTFLDDKFISKVISSTINKDCEARNARKGYLVMNHEVTTRKSIFLKKKKYIMSAIWEDGKLFNNIKLKFKGVELKRGSMSESAKKILRRLIDKYLIDNVDKETIRKECLKVFKYIKTKKDKNLIYQISSVSGLDDIVKGEDNIWYSKSGKKHIQMQIALSWYNFIEENNLTDKYKPPFERQKMQYYYCNENSKYKVIGIPDDIDFNDIERLPEPDWNKMIIQTIIKPYCRYILNKPEVNDKDIETFLLGVKVWDF